MAQYNPPKNELVIFNPASFNQPNTNSELEAEIQATQNQVNLLQNWFNNYGSVTTVTLPNTAVNGNLVNYPIYTTTLQPGNYIIRVKFNIYGGGEGGSSGQENSLNSAFLYVNGQLIYYTYGNRGATTPSVNYGLVLCTTQTYNFTSATTLAYAVSCAGYYNAITTMYLNQTVQTYPLSPYCTQSNICIMRIT